MTTNSSGGIYRCGEGEPTEMEAFDPPPEVRALLRECYFNWSAAQGEHSPRLDPDRQQGPPPAGP